MRIHFNKQALSLLAGITTLVIVCACVLGLVDKLLSGTENPVYNPSEQETLSYTDGNSAVYYGDAMYQLRKTLETVLIIGIDKDNTAAKENSEQADFLLLLVLDKETNSYRVLQIDRDTMVDIQNINELGQKANVFRDNISLSHAFGVTERQRCDNTVNSVKNLLLGIPIDHVVSMTMDVVQIMNDSVGGSHSI